jgi:hypothetical protein
MSLEKMGDSLWHEFDRGQSALVKRCWILSSPNRQAKSWSNDVRVHTAAIGSLDSDGCSELESGDRKENDALRCDYRLPRFQFVFFTVIR